MAFTCPRCGGVSYHPVDEQENYCSRCHASLGGPAEVKEGNWTLMPPAPGLCPTCAVDHGPQEPHNPASLYWQTARSLEGRPQPTWTEALAHCSDEVYAEWRELLAVYGNVEVPERP